MRRAASPDAAELAELGQNEDLEHLVDTLREILEKIDTKLETITNSTSRGLWIQKIKSRINPSFTIQPHHLPRRLPTRADVADIASQGPDIQIDKGRPEIVTAEPLIDPRHLFDMTQSGTGQPKSPLRPASNIVQEDMPIAQGK